MNTNTEILDRLMAQIGDQEQEQKLCLDLRGLELLEDDVEARFLDLDDME